jgi:hypothetical protein
MTLILLGKPAASDSMRHQNRVRAPVGRLFTPRYIDVAILQLEKEIGKPAIHQSGQTFAELRQTRAEEDNF